MRLLGSCVINLRPLKYSLGPCAVLNKLLALVLEIACSPRAISIPDNKAYSQLLRPMSLCAP